MLAIDTHTKKKFHSIFCPCLKASSNHRLLDLYVMHLKEPTQHLPLALIKTSFFLSYCSWWACDNLHRPKCCFFTLKCYLHHICTLTVALWTNTPSHITDICSHEPSVVNVPCLPLIALSQHICSKYSILREVTKYIDQKWLQRRSISRKFTVTRHQAWAPQETIQASGICAPLIDEYNNYSPHYHHHRRLAPMHRCCVVARS